MSWPLKSPRGVIGLLSEDETYNMIVRKGLDLLLAHLIGAH